MKTVTLICTLALLIGVNRHAFVIHAQEPEATPSSVTESLKERLQRAVQSENAQVAGTVTEQKTTFGLIGTLEKIVGSTVQIKTYQGTTRIGEVDKAATIRRLGRAITYEELELNSPVTATGVFGQSGEYRITSLRIVDDSIFPSRRQTLLGTLSTLTTKAINFSPIGPQDGAPSTVPVTTRTTYLDILGQKVDKKLFKAGQQIVTVLPEGNAATASAQRIYSLTLTPTSTRSGTVGQ